MDLLVAAELTREPRDGVVTLHWQMNLLLFGLMVMLMAIILGIGLVEGRIRGYWRRGTRSKRTWGRPRCSCAPGAARRPSRSGT